VISRRSPELKPVEGDRFFRGRPTISVMSALPRITDSRQTSRHVRKVQKEKSRPDRSMSAVPLRGTSSLQIDGEFSPTGSTARSSAVGDSRPISTLQRNLNGKPTNSDGLCHRNRPCAARSKTIQEPKRTRIDRTVRSANDVNLWALLVGRQLGPFAAETFGVAPTLMSFRPCEAGHLMLLRDLNH
jgi:hypothetical protein